MSAAIISPPAQENALLLRSLKGSDGLARVDLDRFWADQEEAVADPFGDIPQVPLGIRMHGECVYAELGVAEDGGPPRGELVSAYNAKAVRLVGRPLLKAGGGKKSGVYPAVKKLHDVFEARNVWHSGSWWLEQSASNADELAALLDRVEQRDIRAFILPPDWEAAKQRLAGTGVKPPLYRGQRGPVTFAMSIYGVENLIFLILDKPALAARFRDTISRVMLDIARVLDEEAGYTPDTAPHGFSFCDDNSALLTPEMYEFFGYPILKAIWDRYSPNPGDRRFQHSDSAMGHLLPILGRLHLTGTNFGPTVTVREIRQHLPHAVIAGQLAPFTFMRNDEEGIVAEFLRDFAMAREARGLLFATAGSVNGGSRLRSLRLIMSLIQHHGRYDRL